MPPKTESISANPDRPLDQYLGSVYYRVCNHTGMPCGEAPGIPAAFKRPAICSDSTPPATITFSAQLLTAGPPVAAETDFRPLFHSRDSWQVEGDKAGWRRCFLQSPDTKSCLWDVQLDPARQTAAIACGPDLITNATCISPLYYPLNQLLLIYALASEGGLILHAAGAILNNTAWVFPGPSGAGKTTLSALLHAESVPMLSDDRIIIRRVGSRFFAYGSPWPGEGGYALNQGLPLGGICFLEKAAQNTLAPLSLKNALNRLLPVTSLLWYEAEELLPMLDTCEQLLTSSPIMTLQFQRQPQVVEVIRRACEKE